MFDRLKHWLAGKLRYIMVPLIGRMSVCAVLAEGAQEREVAEVFLREHMPAGDRSRVEDAKFQKLWKENIDYALRARAEFSWAQRVPEELFLNDVLPYAILDETRESWRPDFYARFKAVVGEAKTQREAILLINRAIKDNVGVVYSTKRKKPNQSPSESMESGLASCTGLSILLVDAFRSVGIPARVAGIPAWTTKRGNHNWVEVWLEDDQQWHYTEYYLDSKGLDHAWFAADAALADSTKPEHSIYASSWKKTGKAFPMVWNIDSRDVPAVLVTERYAKEQAVEAGTEVRVEARSGEDRVATKVEFYMDGKMFFSGTTPKPTDDNNAYLTFHSELEGAVEMVWKGLDGEQKKKSVLFKKQEDPHVIRISLGAE
ncbi:transglutaminase family protein [Rubritalea tangerina]|uniref:Transglutaminase family protein n=2 Tax=Rubritalea tangerina TaxID=430798 RepID=A0ABW4ZBU0_9BACT